ncbi:hypothetical protein TNCV_1365601 [Trichonephila clavipes]|nr:hypothetical protein TNCV_1365601 [Trichonephila clavipes]
MVWMSEMWRKSMELKERKLSSKPRSLAHCSAAACSIAMKYNSSMKVQLYAISSSRLSDVGLKVPRNPDARRTFVDSVDYYIYITINAHRIYTDSHESDALTTRLHTAHINGDQNIALRTGTRLKRRHCTAPISNFVVLHTRVAIPLYAALSVEAEVMVTVKTADAAASFISSYEQILGMLQSCPLPY